VAQPLPLRRTLHDAGDVDELHGGVHGLGGVVQPRELVEARVGQPDHADVRLDRGKGVVRRERGVLGQRVEERRLADVGQADDSDGQAHGLRVYGPAVAASSIAQPDCRRWRTASAVSARTDGAGSRMPGWGSLSNPRLNTTLLTRV